VLGRFVSRDPFAGRQESPASLHRYVYANGDPINVVDPTGLETMAELLSSLQIRNIVQLATNFPKALKACKAVGDAKAIFEFAWWTTLFSSVGLAYFDFNPQLGFTIVQSKPKALGGVTKAEIRLAGTTGSAGKTGDAILSLAFDLASGLKLGGDLNITNPIKSNLNFGTNTTLSTQSECGVEIYKIDLERRLKAGAGPLEGIDASPSGNYLSSALAREALLSPSLSITGTFLEFIRVKQTLYPPQFFEKWVKQEFR
jgi:hypothetical protein